VCHSNIITAAYRRHTRCSAIKVFDMARRMFATQIVNSDPFLDLPSSTQALYFHLGVHCDDDGFVYPKKVIRMVGASDDELKLLLAKKFLVAFESGVVVQKHWRINNYIRPDRYQKTAHVSEMAQLRLDSGKVYHLDTVGIPSGSISKEVSKKVKGSKDPEMQNPSKELTTEESSARIADLKKKLRA
jgi:hypothetical protein